MAADRPMSSGSPVCAVTGSGGYVGSGIVRRLGADGAAIVEFRRNPAPGQSSHRRFSLGAKPELSQFSGIDVLVHCAYDFKAHGWNEIRSVNVDGTRQLIESASKAGIARFVIISSISAFPGCRSLYGRAKLEIEAIAADYGAVIIRPGLVHGPRPGGMFSALGSLAAFPVAIPMLDSGGAVQFLAHEDDLGNLISMAVMRSAGVGTAPIVAAHSRGYTLAEVMTAIAISRGRKPRFISIPSNLASVGLLVLESVGLRPRFRRDSLISLLNQNLDPDFSILKALGLSFRPFEIPKVQ